MANFSPNIDRKVIPRWRTFSDTLLLHELDPADVSKSRQEIATDFLSSKLASWERHKTSAHAADAVGAGISLGCESDVAHVARFLLRESPKSWFWGRQIASRLVGPTPNSPESQSLPCETSREHLHAQIRTRRQLLRLEPRDPISWVDLSRDYVALGHGDKAMKCMDIALTLANRNRFVLRSSSRLWVHLDRPDKAHGQLVRSPRTRHDPWLLAAEIATAGAAGVIPKFTKAARLMLDGHKKPATHVSELASALATLEMASGKTKKARKLFRRSLESPTDNSIAQAVWAHNLHLPFVIDDQYLKFPNAFEAGSWSYYFDEDWHKAVEQCELWQFDQPFSRRPGIQGSYVAAVALDDYVKCKELAERGLRSNPKDLTLLNNYTFALINLGEIQKAQTYFSKMRSMQNTISDQVTFLATQGLLGFRTGEIAQGRDSYTAAIELARRAGHQRELAIALYFFAKEELAYTRDSNNNLVSEALTALRRVDKDPSPEMLREKLMSACERLK